MSGPFQPATSGLDFLNPNPPGEMPSAPDVQEATAKSPFAEALDMDAIFKNLILDRPLKLSIPKQYMHPDFEFRIINSIPSEITAAHNKGFREVTDPELCKLFDSLIAGTDKTGKAFRPILCARPRAVGEHVRKAQRTQLRSLYAGMDPKNKELDGQYTKGVDKKDGTFLDRQGSPWRIKV